MEQHGLLASGGGTADRCIRFWNRLTGQALRSVDTGNDVTGYFCRLRLIGRQSHGLISDIIQLKNESTVDENWTSWNNLSTNIREAVRVPPGLVISLQDCENFGSNRSRMKIRNRNWSIMPIKLSDSDPQNQDQLGVIESLNNKSGFVLPSGKQPS
ncbi:unnamed protein product [Schistosoma mattheei]|uniref:Uncharacterized protein n=1 Tax=Schistosoma mattheei TaxID=31246 RepID=A0A183P1C9_9TREM|nr:unnamed protein product [Schistosoma mattheei]